MLVDIIKTLASSCASNDKGTWTAIWSPSKSALKAAQTNGCNWIALPSIRTGSKAWIPSLWSVGALFKRTGCSLITSSKISQTSGVCLSTILLDCLTVDENPNDSNFEYIKGLNNSKANFLGNPHWWSLSSGPTTITERPE